MCLHPEPCGFDLLAFERAQGDVDYSPLVLSYAVIHEDNSLDWFVEARKISSEMRDHPGGGVRIVSSERIEEKLKTFHGKTVWLDRTNSCAWFEERLKEAGAVILDRKDPCIAMKALKTAKEQAALRRAHIRDGVAVTRFLKWLDAQKSLASLTEMDVEEKLEEFRALDPAFRGPSFGTIAGAGPNGAVIHYRATEKTNRVLDRDSLLLIDSGGQYLGDDTAGTTDITRTVAIGTPSGEMRENFTRVLKGHIALARARFPEGTTGMQLDTLARRPLWEAGLDYAHGTGHGVGVYLGVHEEAAPISPRGNIALAPGMLISNEPGYYREGAYGIRIENLVLVREDGLCESTGRKMLCFETVTLAPLERALIVPEMLEREEKVWLNGYFERLQEMLGPLLDNDTRQWLTAQTLPY